MSTTIEGIYRNGKIELSETLSDVCEGIHFAVTFLSPSSIYLWERGIDKAQHDEEKAKLQTL